jgi:hypothetical protein
MSTTTTETETETETKPKANSKRPWVVVDVALAGSEDAAQIVYAATARAALVASSACFTTDTLEDLPAKQAVQRKAFRLAPPCTVPDASELALPCDPAGTIFAAAFEGLGVAGGFYVYPLAAAQLDLSHLDDIHATREEWFQAFIAGARSVFGVGGLPPLPEKVRVGVGFPSKGQRSRVLGECWHSGVAADGAREIILRPDHGQHQIDKLAPVLVHELLHASLPDGEGHGPTFRRCMPLVGIVGDSKSTEGGLDFLRIWGATLSACGSFPQAEMRIAVAQTKKQPTRMIKCCCRNERCETQDPERGEGYICRTTATWIEEYGAPICPACGEGLTSANKDQEEGEGEE